MSDMEHITLLGGPEDGRLVTWDGGDMMEIRAQGTSSSVLKDPPIVRFHVYQRAQFKRDMFTWQGIRP
jgi:hypothetical protein